MSAAAQLPQDEAILPRAAIEGGNSLFDRAGARVDSPVGLSTCGASHRPTTARTKSEAPPAPAWASGKEQVTSSRPIHFLIFCARHLPLWLVGVGVLMTSAVYYVFSSRARNECRRYQQRVIDYTGGRTLHRPRIFRQIMSFALCVTEKVEGWLGRIRYEDVTFHDDDVAELKEQLGQGRGAFLIGSHLGNLEVLRSIAVVGQTGTGRDVPVTILMEKKSTDKFNHALEEMNQGIRTEVIGVDSIEPDTIVALMERLETGGMVVVAGDRTPRGGRHRLLTRQFMGQTASFPYGTFLLPALLKAPTYIFFALRKKDFMWHPKYDMFVQKSSVTFDECPRYERETKVNALCDQFVSSLERYCLEYPFQWCNFYDFWQTENDNGSTASGQLTRT